MRALTLDEVAAVIAKGKMSDEHKATLLRQCMAGDPHALFSVQGMAARQRRSS